MQLPNTDKRLEIPSNLVMEKWFTFRSSLWMAIITVGWGVMMTLVCCKRAWVRMKANEGYSTA
jgi:hypothetical protein